MFILDKRLADDTYEVANLQYCQLLLSKNANYPWFILVPRQENLIEFTDLSFQDQINILQEINLIAKFLQQKFQCDKINIATLGNVVKQLHIHIIARFKDDISFPRPVWSDEQFKEYPEKKLKLFIKDVKNAILDQKQTII